MMIKLRYTITFHNKAKNLGRYYQNVLNSTFSIWQKGAHFVSNFLLFARIRLVFKRISNCSSQTSMDGVGVKFRPLPRSASAPFGTCSPIKPTTLPDSRTHFAFSVFVFNGNLLVFFSYIYWANASISFYFALDKISVFCQNDLLSLYYHIQIIELTIECLYYLQFFLVFSATFAYP